MDATRLYRPNTDRLNREQTHLCEILDDMEKNNKLSNLQMRGCVKFRSRQKSQLWGTIQTGFAVLADIVTMRVQAQEHGPRRCQFATSKIKYCYRTRIV